MALLPSYFFTKLVDLLAESSPGLKPEGVVNSPAEIHDRLDLYTRTSLDEVRHILGEKPESASTNNRSRR